jgi:hypothetical protein
MNIDELLSTLRAEHQQHFADAEAHHRIAEKLLARIQGIEEAREALTSTPVDNRRDYKLPTRRPRRDIRAMVREALSNSVTPDRVDAKVLAESLGCRTSQVEAALKALNHTRALAEPDTKQAAQ